MTLPDVFIVGLATHRIIGIWSGDEILRTPREWALKTWVAPLAKCPFCLSVWVALALVAAWLYGGRFGPLPSLVFAVSGIAVYLEYVLRIVVVSSNRPTFPRM